MKWLRRITPAFAVHAIPVPLPNVLELPNKLVLNGALCLAVRQDLYRGWRSFIVAPAEIGSLVTALAMLALRRHDPQRRGLTLLAALAYAGMLAAFFVLDAPVNAAVPPWMASTLPRCWQTYRVRRESGHAIALVLSGIALAVLVRCAFVETTG